MSTSEEPILHSLALVATTGRMMDLGFSVPLRFLL